MRLEKLIPSELKSFSQLVCSRGEACITIIDEVVFYNAGVKEYEEARLFLDNWFSELKIGKY